ncbi:MAG: hypothetical protein F4Z28_18030 [Gammaproteobacteria bacterium]|nr:hypothetical protein [Gammaproteobacteria bacterium]
MFIVAGLLLALASMVGCTTLQSTRLPPEEIRYGIRNGSLVQPGDQISVVTNDGKERVLKVREVEADAIRGALKGGEETEVAIDDVVALSTPQLEPVRTVFYAFGASMGTLYLLALLALYL